MPFYQIESEEREEDVDDVDNEHEEGEEEEEIEEESTSGEFTRKYILKMLLLKPLDNYESQL